MNDAQLMIQVRRKLGLNQQDMAKRMGYTSKYVISHIEGGRKGLSGPARKLLELLNKLSDTTNTGTSEPAD